MHGVATPRGPGPPSLSKFHDHTVTHTTIGMTPLDEWSARRRDPNLKTQNIHKRETSMPPVGFESAIPASMRPHTHAFDRAATVVGCMVYSFHGFCTLSSSNGSGTRLEFIPLCYSYWNL